MVNKILTYALKEVGVHEYPPNTNIVKYNTEYYGREVSGSAYPWCCVFQWSIFKNMNMSHLFCNGKKVASCRVVHNEMKNHVVKNPKKGDLVLFNFNSNYPNHIGIIYDILEDGTIITIEGNTSLGNDINGGSVAKRTRNRKNVHSFIRPQYIEIDNTKLYYQIPTLSTNSIVDALKSINVNDSFDFRIKIAKKNGIEDYSGTYSQNVHLLKMLKNGSLLKP